MLAGGIVCDCSPVHRPPVAVRDKKGIQKRVVSWGLLNRVVNHDGVFPWGGHHASEKMPRGSVLSGISANLASSSLDGAPFQEPLRTVLGTTSYQERLNGGVSVVSC
jgi:hypothetical protein